jgi:hypothetical protein
VGPKEERGKNRGRAPVRTRRRVDAKVIRHVRRSE